MSDVVTQNAQRMHDNGDGSFSATSWPQNGATTRGTAGFIAPLQTAKSWAGKISIATGATIPLETVAPGKILLITDIYISSDSATQFESQIQSAGIPIFRAEVKGDTAPVQQPGIESQPFGTSGSLVQLVLAAVATTNVLFTINGVEQPI